MQPAHRKRLNQEQLKVLRSLYTFRFGTAELFAKSHGGATQRYMNERLRILCEQQYIGRKYDGLSRLYGRPATYFLLDKGFDVLKQSPEVFDKRALVRLKRRVGNNGMWHYINVFRTFIRCRELYGDSIKFLTKSNLVKVSYFPKDLPDAYVVFKDADTAEIRRAIIEYFDWSKSLGVIKKRIMAVVAYFDSGEWPSDDYPDVWIICETPELEQRVRKWLTVALERSWESHVAYYTTSKSDFFTVQSAEEIWRTCTATDQ